MKIKGNKNNEDSSPLHDTFIGELLHLAKLNNPSGRTVFRERMRRLTGKAWGRNLLSTYETGKRIPRADTLSTLRIAACIGKGKFNRLVEKWYVV